MAIKTNGKLVEVEKIQRLFELKKAYRDFEQSLGMAWLYFVALVGSFGQKEERGSAFLTSKN